MYLLSRSLLGRADTRIRTPLPAPASLVRFVSRYTARLGVGQASNLQAMLVLAPEAQVPSNVVLPEDGSKNEEGRMAWLQDWENSALYCSTHSWLPFLLF